MRRRAACLTLVCLFIGLLAPPCSPLRVNQQQQLQLQLQLQHQHQQHLRAAYPSLFDGVSCWSANAFLDAVRKRNAMGDRQLRPAGLYRARTAFGEADMCRVLTFGDPALNVKPLVVRATRCIIRTASDTPPRTDCQFALEDHLSRAHVDETCRIGVQGRCSFARTCLSEIIAAAVRPCGLRACSVIADNLVVWLCLCPPSA
jgi:hypothetical protein